MFGGKFGLVFGEKFRAFLLWFPADAAFCKMYAFEEMQHDRMALVFGGKFGLVFGEKLCAFVLWFSRRCGIL